ncbi:MAG: methylmalonyl-CoA mutase, partial [Deltaproteobacteria bacterium]|nr:methylmalonyl-CoA mutase [Deltaproteobacteria bacterium]
RVFLANIGPLARHKPRADFTTGYFQAGGFEVISSPGFDSMEEAAAAAVDSGAKVVVMCGADKDYPNAVPALCRAVKDKDPGITLLLAGKPAPDLEGGYRSAGMDDYIFLGQNVYEMLANLQEKA